MNGHNFFTDPDTYDLSLRELVCEIVWQAYCYATRRGWSNIIVCSKGTRYRRSADEQAAAIAYIMSPDFELQVEGLDLPDDFVERIREKIRKQRYWQYPLEVMACEI